MMYARSTGWPPLHPQVQPVTLWLTAVCAVQAAIQPPTFVMFVNDTKLIDDQYKTYLARQLRDNIDLTGTPIRLLFRGKPPSSDRRQPPGGNAD